MPVDANGKKLRDLSGRGIMFQNMHLKHPDWTDKQCAEAIGGASATAIAGWKKHPQYRGTIGYYAEKDEAAAKSEGLKWIARVKRRGQRAEAAGDMGNALRSDELLVKHVPMEGLLSGRDMPAQGGDTYNTLIVNAGELKRRFTLEQLRVLAQLPGDAP